jgi:hypothetical protein
MKPAAAEGHEAEKESQLSRERDDIEQLERELKRIGILDPSTGIKEKRGLRDPMLTILFNPLAKVTVPSREDPSVEVETTVIDELLLSAHEECERAYGNIYTDFVLIQETMQTLLHSKDTPAKQMTLLCLLAIEEGLQRQLACHYPADGGPEVQRLDDFIPLIKIKMEDTLNIAYVNVPRPSVYNVGNLLREFLVACAEGYPG